MNERSNVLMRDLMIVHFTIFPDIDECIESSKPCPDPGTICVNTVGAYECTRTIGKPIPRLPTDRNLPDRQETVRPSSMTCLAGYKPANDSGISTCVDVDECNEQLHSCELDERCVNEIGSYRCDSTNAANPREGPSAKRSF